MEWTYMHMYKVFLTIATIAYSFIEQCIFLILTMMVKMNYTYIELEGGVWVLPTFLFVLLLIDACKKGNEECSKKHE